MRIIIEIDFIFRTKIGSSVRAKNNQIDVKMLLKQHRMTTIWYIIPNISSTQYEIIVFVFDIASHIMFATLRMYTTGWHNTI